MPRVDVSGTAMPGTAMSRAARSATSTAATATSDRVRAKLERLASLQDTERLLRMTRQDLAAELEDIANRYLDVADWLGGSGAGRRHVEQERVALVRARPTLVQP